MTLHGRTIPTFIALALFAVACGGQPADGPANSPGPTTPSPTSSPDPTPSPTGGALEQACASPVGGYRIGYPQGWHVNSPEAGPACSWFHPEPFQLPQDSEATGIAISVRTENAEFERIVQGITEGPHVKELADRSSSTVGGGEAVRAEIVHSGEGLFPEGTRETTWVVRRDGQPIVASTTNAAEGDYSRHVEVLDRMMQSLQPYQSEGKCSAAALDPALPDQQGLPEPVLEMRREIASAAVKCDFAKLAELARRRGGNFTYSFGDGGDPAAFWRREEAEDSGSKPMLHLVGVLKRSHATRQVRDATHYLWPAAFIYENWAMVPEPKRKELEPLYGPTDFARFGQFGGYAGYRVGIDQSGDWLYFVAGD